MKKRIVKTLLGAALAASMIASTCTGVLAESEENVTLTWAVFETDNYTAEVWQHIIDAFEADNPGIKIEKVLMTGDSRPQFLKTMLSAGNMPDINIDPVDLASTEGVYAEVPEELLAKFEDSAVVSFNGVKNLVPAYKAYRTQVFYNKHQFEDAGITEVPTTWDEFIQVCDTLQEAGYTPLMGVGAADIWATAFGYWTGVVNSELYTAYPNFNEDILSGELSWENDVLIDTLKSWQTLTPYYHKGSMSFSNTQATSEFLSGSAAMFMDGAWSTTTIDNSDEYSADDFGTFMMPTPSGAKTYCTMPQYWGVSETCENKEAAFKFCEYVLGGNPDIYRYYLQADGTFSVTKDPVTYEMGPVQTEFVNNLEGYTLVPEAMKVVGDNAFPTGFEDYTLKSLQNIFTGADVEQELSTWDAEMERLASAQ
ncbi:MAG TPA: extracellular solute-binding protein [Candidatus Blautia faecavium]|uniref:Probable sugar-binding periplasmic protein n=2 Tax=Blautia TaxID=572511 RepID=A0A9D2DUZ3_9FIRM|nr:extracellular solute-binding protein [Candidatus Blautia faecigallinarum]HJB27239.1 extracellular solute-binding protein [Candidatus Blautia faecavium]